MLIYLYSTIKMMHGPINIINIRFNLMHYHPPFISSINLYMFWAYLQPIIRRCTLYIYIYIYTKNSTCWAFQLTLCWPANTYQLLYMYNIPPDDGLQVCPRHVEVDRPNKLRINSASSWFLLHRCMEMHNQQTIKFNRVEQQALS